MSDAWDKTGGDLPDDLAVLSPVTRRSARVIALFLRQAPIELARLEAAIAEGDRETTKDVAHKLKGSCRAVGASRVAELCDLIERSEVSDASSKYGRLVIELDRARALLEAEQAKIAG